MRWRRRRPEATPLRQTVLTPNGPVPVTRSAPTNYWRPSPHDGRLTLDDVEEWSKQHGSLAFLWPQPTPEALEERRRRSREVIREQSEHKGSDIDEPKRFEPATHRPEELPPPYAEQLGEVAFPAGARPPLRRDDHYPAPSDSYTSGPAPQVYYSPEYSKATHCVAEYPAADGSGTTITRST